MRLKIVPAVLVAAICYSFPVVGQDNVKSKITNHKSSIDSVLRSIEANSTTLRALKKQTEAEKLAGRTGIFLANPEAEFGYLWGRPKSTGNQTDFSITQSFDFPTAYVHRSRIADGRSRIADYDYNRNRRDLLLQTMTVCVQLVYCNTLRAEAEKRFRHAQSLASAMQKLFERGEADILERNNIQLNLLNARKALEANNIERDALLSELQRLNGGQPIAFDDTSYPDDAIPADFHEWYDRIRQSDPELQAAAEEIAVSERQIKLNRALSLPKISAGYASEAILGTMLQGFTVGISIPFTENKNTIKQAKVQTAAWQNIEADTRIQLYHRLKTQYDKAVSLQAMAGDYRKALQTINNEELLGKALDLGQLSLVDYISELSIYYETMDNVLQAERDARLAVLELRIREE